MAPFSSYTFKIRIFCGFIAATVLIIFTIYRDNNRLSGNYGKKFENDNFIAGTFEYEEINIALVICGDGQLIEKALVMMKSALIFCGSFHVHFLIVCQDHLRWEVNYQLQILDSKVANVFTYELYSTYFPEVNKTIWQYWYKECATQRLFFPAMFPNIGKILFVDLDVLFMTSLSEIWQPSHEMNQSQLIAAGPGFLNRTWYEQVYKPSYPLSEAKLLNAGILIMDLEKMRQFGWISLILKLFYKYHEILPNADQDLIRLAVLFYPDKLHLLPCNYNFFSSNCWTEVPCQEAQTQGVFFVHASGNSYRKFKIFGALFQAFQEYQIGIDPKEYLITSFIQNVQNVKIQSCRCLKNSLFLKNIHKMLN